MPIEPVYNVPQAPQIIRHEDNPLLKKKKEKEKEKDKEPDGDENKKRKIDITV